MEPSGKGLPLPGIPSLYAFIITGFPRIALIQSSRLTHCDILPCFVSSELGKRNLVGSFQREPVLRRMGHDGKTERDTTNAYTRRDLFTFHLNHLPLVWLVQFEQRRVRFGETKARLRLLFELRRMYLFLVEKLVVTLRTVPTARIAGHARGPL